MTSTALITPLPVVRFPYKIAPNVPNNMPRNRLFCSFASLSIVSLTPFIKKATFSRDLTIFMISLVSSFGIISVVTPDPKIFFWLAAFVADAAAVSPYGIKTLLAHGLSTFLFKDKLVFSNDLKSLPKNPPNCTILDSWIFENFILADERFAKALRIESLKLVYQLIIIYVLN